MILGILGFVFSIMGIVGYFNGMSVLLAISAVCIVAEAVIGLCTGELRSLSTYIVAVIIGYFVAVFTKANVLSTVAVALCFEDLVLGIISLVYLTVIGIVTSKHSKKDRTNE